MTSLFLRSKLKNQIKRTEILKILVTERNRETRASWNKIKSNENVFISRLKGIKRNFKEQN